MSETNTDLNPPTDGANEPVDTAIKAIPPEAPKPEVPAHPDWRDRRLANITRERREAEERASSATQRAEQLERELSQFRQQQRPAGEPDQPKPLDANEIGRQAEQRAVDRMRTEAAEQKFMADCNSTADKIKGEFGDAGLNVAATGWVNAGLNTNKPAHRELLELITSIDGGYKLYHSIGTDPNFAAHLLELSPVKAAFELAKLLPAAEARQVRAEAVAAAADVEATEPVAAAPVAPVAPTPRPISNAPRPPSQPAASRGASAGSSNLSEMSMADYAAARRKQMAGG